MLWMVVGWIATLELAPLIGQSRAAGLHPGDFHLTQFGPEFFDWGRVLRKVRNRGALLHKR